MTMIVRLVAPPIALIALASCSRDRALDRDRPLNNEPGTTTLTGANVQGLPSASAVGRIVEVRCARETSCKNIGAGADKRFASQEACLQKIRVDMKDDFNVNDCPQGVEQRKLDECLAEIRNESCNSPIDALQRLSACRTNDMCVRTRAPNR